MIAGSCFIGSALVASAYNSSMAQHYVAPQTVVTAARSIGVQYPLQPGVELTPAVMQGPLKALPEQGHQVAFSHANTTSQSSLLWLAAPMTALFGLLFWNKHRSQAVELQAPLWSIATIAAENEAIHTEPMQMESAATDKRHAAERTLVTLQETASRSRIEAEQRGFFNLFSEIQPAKAAAVAAAAIPVLAPAAALASGGAVPTSITPDLIAGVAGGVSMVAFGQYLYDKAGGHAHGPPEAEHPIDPASQPFPEGEDGEALKAVFTEPYDIWRQSLLRYLGYSNELGEAFRPLVGDFLANSTYAVAIAYVLADSIDKAGRASERARELAAAAVFMQMDEGLHGQLKHDDLQAALKTYKAPLSTAEMEEFLIRADVRKDNNIDFDEFYLALKRKDSAIMKFLEAGAANLPQDQAKPWRRAMQDGVNLTEVRSAIAGLDALLWQLTASVAMPGFTINRIVALTGAICYGWKTALAGAVDPAMLDLLNYIPTIIGLLSITVIVHPLDTLADELFNVTIRKYVFKKAPVDQTGQLTEADMIKKLSARGEGNPLPNDWMKRLFNDVDTDKDGFISLTEWRRNGIGAYNKYVESLKSPW